MLQAIKKGLQTGFITQIATMLITFLSGIILMRLVDPEIFGVVVILNLIVNFLLLFNSLGIPSAVIQAKEISHLQLSSMFWLITFIALFLYLILGLLIPFSDGFFEQPLSPYLWYSGLVIPLTGLNMIQLALFARNLQFKELNWINVKSLFLGQSLTIGLVYFGFGIWALVFAPVLLNSIKSLFVWRKSDFRPSLKFDLSLSKPFLYFGLPLFGTNLMKYVVSQLDNLLVGRKLGNVSLGLYSRAYTLIVLPSNGFGLVIRSVLLPVLSQNKTKSSSINGTHFIMYYSISFMFLVAYLLSIFVSEGLVELVLGQKWMGIVPFIPFLIGIAFSKVIMSLDRQFLISKGFTKTDMFLNVFYTLFISMTLIVSINYGIEILLRNYMISSLINVLVSLIVVMRINKISPYNYIIFFFFHCLFIVVSFLVNIFIDSLSINSLMVTKLVSLMILSLSYVYLYKKRLLLILRKIENSG